jgi:hypothetical protein
MTVNDCTVIDHFALPTAESQGERLLLGLAGQMIELPETMWGRHDPALDIGALAPQEPGSTARAEGTDTRLR